MNRRDFLQRSAVIIGGMSIGIDAFADRLKEIGKPRLKVGIVSDIHIKDKASTATFRHVLEVFRDKNVDAVMVAGDMADWSLTSQLEWVGECWYDVFPKDRKPNGEKVEKLFIYGNHDVKTADMILKKYDVTPEKAEREAIGPQKAEIWKKVFHEKWQPIYMKEVKGYKFIGAHFDGFSGIQHLDEYLEGVSAKLPKDKPFFYFQHMHPKDTCSAPWTWGQDNGKTTKALSKYSNAISFSGHSHTTLTDERTIWQGAFTSIGTASLSYIAPFGGRENTAHTNSKEVIRSQMKRLDCKNGKQGQIMTVYDDYIQLEKWDFLNDILLSEDWIIHLPHLQKEGSEFAFETRAKKAKAPQFAATDAVTLSRAMGTDRDDKEEDQITVSFPSVLKKRTGVRAFDYEVQAEVEDIDTYKIWCTKRVFSKGFYMPEEKDEDRVECKFAVSELLKNRRVRFAVRPVECFGKKGEPIYSEWIALGKKKK